MRSFTVADVRPVAPVEAGDTVWVALPRFSGPDSPEIAVTTSPQLAVVQASDSLRLRTLATGAAAVSVRATAAGYRDTTVTLAVDVVPGVCPPGPSMGARDYFPAASGDVWRFDMEEYVGTSSTYDPAAWAAYGTVTATVEWACSPSAPSTATAPTAGS